MTVKQHYFTERRIFLNKITIVSANHYSKQNVCKCFHLNVPIEMESCSRQYVCRSVIYVVIFLLKMNCWPFFPSFGDKNTLITKAPKERVSYMVEKLLPKFDFFKIKE